jgi:hypothetical protein
MKGRRHDHGRDAVSGMQPVRTPRPRDTLQSGQVSWLAGRCHPSGLPGDLSPVTLIDGQLAAYSCGDSFGMSAHAPHRIPS